MSTLPDLNKDDLIETRTGTPDHLAMYAYDVQGPGAVVRAVGDLIAGELVRFAICKRTAAHDHPRVLYRVAIQAIPNRACIRWCGKSDDPYEIGSSTLLGSILTDGTAEDLNPLEIAAHLASVLSASSPWYFRLKA